MPPGRRGGKVWAYAALIFDKNPEKNLQQLNAMYEANPRILEDVHRAVQGGSGEAFL
ncbi:unnamed protein product [Symbiodinium natans]|uniref:Uncharacterized protein n=1 Tax=Symbiodinium natans TaxID=878477 RepID=A0A812MRZ8_9DINO|nr:unnamed protein product [Symbiodinium natans]